MRSVSHPGYLPALPQSFSPTYTQPHEYWLALDLGCWSNKPPGSFVKQTKGGHVSLRLVDQDSRLELPVYGLAGSVQGMVEISKSEGITSVEAQVEGILKLEEIAEGGTSTHKLFSTKSVLWVKDRIQDAPCPNSLRFRFLLPTTYFDGAKTYYLPPSFEAHLSGLPGFRANASYSISATVVKPNDVSNIVQSTLFRKGGWTVSTPFLYHPRIRPSMPIPSPLVASISSGGFPATSQWKLFSAATTANQRGVRDLVAKLYIPSTRTFCFRQPIPFHLSFHCDADSLRGFLSLAPVAGLVAPRRQATRIQLMRRTSVDVRNAFNLGTKTDIWRIDCIGEGAFREAGNGDDWVAFSGDIFISDEVAAGGFRASGFSVQDYLVLTMTPPDLKSPFKELRMVVPIQLASDRWNGDGTGLLGPLPMSSSEELGVPVPYKTLSNS